IAETGPTVASDLYTVARTLSVLAIDFKGYQSTFKVTLPPPELVPLFGRYDSLYRFLLKGTAANPDDRFQSAEEMADQLFGVLREVVADSTGVPSSAPSKLFTGESRVRPDQPDWTLLPVPLVSSDDPAAGYLATLPAAGPDGLVAVLREAPERTVEVDLRIVRALVAAGGVGEGGRGVWAVEGDDTWGWGGGGERGRGGVAGGWPAGGGCELMGGGVV